MNYLPALALGGVALLLVVVIVVTDKNAAEDWQQFATDHHCKIVEQKRGWYVDTAWRCDDGVIYWR